MTRARTQLVLSWFEAPSRLNKVSPFYTEALVLTEGEEQTFEERAFDTGEFVYAELDRLRGELLRGVDVAGAQLGEMRLDAGSDTPADFARFAELIKLSALTHRLRQGQTIAAALPEVNDLLKGTMSPAQRSEFENSALDQRLLDAEQHAGALHDALAATTPQLGNFVPTVGDEPAPQRVGHRHLPALPEAVRVREGAADPDARAEPPAARHPGAQRARALPPRPRRPPLDRAGVRQRDRGACSRRPSPPAAGATATTTASCLQRARKMLARYADGEYARPDGVTETEVKFSLKLPPTAMMQKTPVGGKLLAGIQINGKIDRIDRDEGGDGARLIDYKTGKKKSVKDVQKDLQLALYRLAASEVLGIDASQLIYYFLENEDPTVQADATEEHVAEVRETIDEVADQIVTLDFAPTPSYQICQFCAFNHVCPATEA